MPIIWDICYGLKPYFGPKNSCLHICKVMTSLSIVYVLLYLVLTVTLSFDALKFILGAAKVWPLVGLSVFIDVCHFAKDFPERLVCLTLILTVVSHQYTAFVGSGNAIHFWNVPPA